MAGRLSGKRVLVVEDEYYIAADIARVLEDQGAVVVGPTGHLEDGLALAGETLDAALLDVNLHGEASFAIAERLSAVGVPYMFLTGYDSWAIPEGYQAVPRLTKPFVMARVTEAVERMVALG
ncbi:MAG TPA: response regulator [Croceibacterium sp.]